MGKYRVVVINPEILMTSDHVEAMWRKPNISYNFDSINNLYI